MRKRVCTMVLALGLLTGCAGAPAQQTEEPVSAEDASAVEVQVEAPQAAEPSLVVAIDPGHQSWDVDMSDTEPVGPGATEYKQKATTGTAGRYSGVAEYALNLDISLLLRDELEQHGYQVVLTREDNQTAISNAERAQLASEAGADIYLRIHANGSEDTSVHGALALVPSAQNPYVADLHESSLQLAQCVLTAYCDATGFSDLGVQDNDTMTGINWSTCPVMILEMGFMNNEQDDLAMADADFRMKMVQGIADGVERYDEQTK